MIQFLPTIEKYRQTRGKLASNRGDRYGNFIFPAGALFPESRELQVIATDGAVFPGSPGHGWEHISACARKLFHGKTFRYYVPTWGEMCALKNIFWEVEDAVVQYHPPASEYVNNHPFVLHLWKPIELEIPRPPAILVGIKEVGEVLNAATK